MKIHKLKTINPYFQDVKSKVKTFELRKNNRDFQVGHILLLMEWNVNEDFQPENQPENQTEIAQTEEEFYKNLESSELKSEGNELKSDSNGSEITSESKISANHALGNYTGNGFFVKITHLFQGGMYGLDENFVILSLEFLPNADDLDYSVYVNVTEEELNESIYQTWLMGKPKNEEQQEGEQYIEEQYADKPLQYNEEQQSKIDMVVNEQKLTRERIRNLSNNSFNTWLSKRNNGKKFKM